MLLWPEQDNRELLAALVERLDCAGMAEAFVRIAAADEASLPNVAPDALAWLADTDLLARLLARRAVASRVSLTPSNRSADTPLQSKLGISSTTRLLQCLCGPKTGSICLAPAATAPDGS